MLSNKQIMENARAALKGNWGKAALFTFILCIVLIAVSITLDAGNFVKQPVIPNQSKGIEGDLSTLPAFLGLGIIFAIFNAFFYAAIAVGEANIFIHLIENGEFNWKLLKNGLNKLLRNTITHFLAYFIPCAILGLVTGAVVGIAVFLAGILGAGGFNTASVIIIAISGLITAGLWGFALYKLVPTYAMLYTKLALDNKVKCIAAIKETYNTVAPHNWAFWCLTCRFTGWLLLCIVTFGIALFWVGPYMSASLYIFYKECVTDEGGDSSTISETSENQIPPEDPKNNEE